MCIEEEMSPFDSCMYYHRNSSKKKKNIKLNVFYILNKKK